MGGTFMLVELAIRHLAVIESVRLSMRSGFHVLTGETGAGKSIIIDALGLVIGGRGSSELVRHGCDKAEIEALFDVPVGHPVGETLAGLGISAAEGDQLVIRREMTAQGKSTCRINGQIVNLTMLREVGERLVNIHGQHEHQSLLRPEEHLHWLDLYGGVRIAEARREYDGVFERYSAVQKRLQELQETSKQALQKVDLYRFQADEIAAAKLKPNEDESLLEERRKLANAEKLAGNVDGAYRALFDGGKGLDSINKATQRLRDVANYDPGVLQPLAEQMQSAFYQLEDAAFQLRDYQEQIEFNPARLDAIERRLDVLAGFRRKYGETVADILAYLQTIEQELALIDNKDDLLKQLEQEAAVERELLAAAAAKLSALRRECAAELGASIERELRDLHMERTRLVVQVDTIVDSRGPEIGGVPAKLTKNGCDQVEFLISPNPGEPLRPLAKIASGGELSRIMLAMKAIFAKVDRIPVLVFDEVDTGVSGRAAQAIAEKLSRLSASCQVFSITHLPQVACMADTHYAIRKQVEDGRTFTRVEDLDEAERIAELARMLGGVEVTGTTRRHAEEMLDLAKEKKAFPA